MHKKKGAKILSNLKKANADIRKMFIDYGLKSVDVANLMGVTVTHLSHLLQTPLSEKSKNKILTALDKYGKENNINV